MKFGLNPAEALVLREALMSYRNRHNEARFREAPDGFRVSAADDLIERLDALGRIEAVLVDKGAMVGGLITRWMRDAEDDSPLGHGTPVPEEATLPSGDARVAGL